MKEAEIVHQFQNGDASAFRNLYDLYFDYAIRAATIVMNNNHFYAKDAVQETFIRVYQNIHLYDPSKPFKPWFYKILLNECNRILKRNSNVISIGDRIGMLEQEGHLKEEMSRYVEYENLYDAIQKLDYHNRIPIILKYLNGFKEQEIAEIMDENINTIKSRLLKGKQKLKRFLSSDKEGDKNG
ncbi:RNA polymerase sigma factor [Ureibacillus sp. 179-F W5.1 NHS]|uniref:Sigma-70 family RNA polymerase sigma factor n=1 Tax=Lysinibacillus halotolerans TaxID=1368476 RepID=A0A3M8HB64_9BACI|nr:sigma-70 family RNA polymerase sigma factor [Lysinibacillus halotolerans]RNC99320.1 sigma-70 family RNA polymerase sigma factor [Lysinibacillus halotolerans]